MPSDAPKDSTTQPAFMRASEIPPTSAEWLWSGRLARGKLTLLAGDPGAAKTTIALDTDSSLLKDGMTADVDIITTDMGWSNPRSIWELDRSILPAGFDDIHAEVEPAGGRLGLWMSPSERYPPVCDYEWAEKSGYVVLRPPR